MFTEKLKIIVAASIVLTTATGFVGGFSLRNIHDNDAI